MTKKQQPQTARSRSNKVTAPSLKISYTVILLAYALITIITPNLEANDATGPKFLALSILNLLAFAFLLTQKDPKSESGPFQTFFRKKIGFVYTLFLAFMLISFTKAINIPEAILTFVKYFTVFIAVYNISAILQFDKRYLRLLSIVMVSVLLIDSFTVFYNVLLYLSKQIASFHDVKSIYSNRNILAAAIFIKIAFALWLYTFESGWLKKFGFFALFCAFLATFFMSARTFYLGLIVLTVVYITFLLIFNLRNKTTSPFKMPGYFLGALVVAYLGFSATQKYLYPKSDDLYGVSVTQRLSNMSSETSGLRRLQAWKNSAELLKHDPILGIGAGNWKIRVLEYENKTKTSNLCMVRNHNDFIQVTAELGIIGGLLYLSIFIIIFLNFLFATIKPNQSEETVGNLFLPAIGLLCYSVDAFFNFPAERPEMQSLFAIFLAVAITYTFPENLLNPLASVLKRNIARILPAIFVLALSTCYLLNLNFKSSRLQRIAEEDVLSTIPRHKSQEFIEGFPFIPNVTFNGIEPIAVTKSRYLLNEGNYQGAIDLLYPDKSNPYDGNREFLLAIAYAKVGKKDSALHYANKAVQLKPYFYPNVSLLTKYLVENSRESEAIKLLKEYVLFERYDSRAWLSLTNLFVMKGDSINAVATLNTAIKYLPNDPLILKEKAKLTK